MNLLHPHLGDPRGPKEAFSIGVQPQGKITPAATPLLESGHGPDAKHLIAASALSQAAVPDLDCVTEVETDSRRYPSGKLGLGLDDLTERGIEGLVTLGRQENKALPQLFRCAFGIHQESNAISCPKSLERPVP